MSTLLRALSLLASVLLAACTYDSVQDSAEAQMAASADKIELSISTDKETYRSMEQLLLQMDIESSMDAECEIYAEGIVARGRPLFKRQMAVNVTKGVSKAELAYQMPSCNSCAGVMPGDYAIDVELRCGGLHAADTRTIGLVQ